MPIATNLMSAVLIAPIVVVLAAISLATLQRSMEWIALIANNPQKDLLKTLRPYFKTANIFLEKVLGGKQFTVSSTTILLMAIAILLICLLLENSAKPKMVKMIKDDKDGKRD